MAEAVVVEGHVDEAPTGRVGGTRQRRRRAALWALVAACAAVYASYSLMRLRAFRASSYDLVIFDQAIRSYSRFELPVAMVKGVHNGFGPHFAILGDHFSPVLALLAPLYWIHDGPGTLLVAQAVLFALAIVPIWRYTERRFGAGAAYCAAAAYALSWPVAEALAFDFHEVAFVPVLSALMVERYDAGRRGWAAAAALSLLLVKEDMGLLLVGFGFFLLTRHDPEPGADTRRHRREAGEEGTGHGGWLPRGDRRAGLAYIVGGLVATWVSSRLIIAVFGGDNDYYWAYGSLGPDLPHAAVHALTNPWDVLAVLGTPPHKLGTMALLVLPLLLLPLASPLTLTVLPLLAERMLASRFGNWWEPHYHYNAFIIAVLVMASVDGAARLRRRLWPRARARLPAALPAAAMLTAAVVCVPFFAFVHLADPALWRRNDRARAAASAAARIPDGALVESANAIGPALSPRARVLLWDGQPRRAPWVIADVERLEFPFRTLAEQRRRVESLLAGGYREVYRADGYIVLHRDVADPW
ncbi:MULTISPECIES: DUF2079 domain-containing protein [Actinomadura]|uniref:DUF2079 domain-containing protein n=1 Tax=Actinomadura litoris TaxID=2678616 RepID=A0A7K1LEA1_9ACTN|nr:MULTISPECIES: DUF2079 domain-containing protein [Actinomadura]MBT2213625.1 DUF2079 domain-containing protein [Actinomadura sp. NEAU-AAG7]MUN42758.1 DUF2079 domain-containing protein [Actinomadura litoris]